MSELTHQEVHARLTSTADNLSKQWLGNWKDDAVIDHIEFGFRKTLEDLDILPIIMSFDKTHMDICIEIGGQWGKFLIEYATGKVGEWTPDDD